MLKDLAKKNRSYRRFYEEKKITMEELLDLIDTGRLVPSGGNKQPLHYMPVVGQTLTDKVFPSIRWAGYLPEWDGPAAGERPTAYIVFLADAKNPAATSVDDGIAGQTMLLAAVEKGMGGCFIGNCDRQALMKDLGIDEKYTIKLVLALGYPKEEVVIDEIQADGDIKYYRDENQVHHVPKFKLEEMIVHAK